LSEMIDRVADALTAGTRPGGLVRSYALYLAEIAVRTMREPTEAMIEAVCNIDVDEFGGTAVARHAAKRIWQIMSDAALSDKPV